ncbi:MAG: glycosyl hydrolase 115 family protein [Nibricoccus sp.]
MWRIVFCYLVFVGCSGVVAAAENRQDGWVTDKAVEGSFPLAGKDRVSPIIVSSNDFTVVRLVAEDFAKDLERVTGRKPTLCDSLPSDATAVVLAGTLGKSAEIDELVRSGKLDVSTVRGQWETFLIAVVEKPFPALEQALVIVGSDRRGTAFGLYELSQAMGVSPWHWWADVAPVKKCELYVSAGTRKFGPPSVRYRGIFINDEDWGLQPWAAKTFSPEEGGIGPKVYRKVFELLLRLKANTLWPAMHKCTKPFNSFPENARLAEDYGIVMGSSHAEPMLRNNVGEWTDLAEKYNYVENRDGVFKYWEERVAANGKFENIYTLGMRGIHDSNMIGPKTDAQRIETLERIFADQRAMIAKHVKPHAEEVPQMFCAYKEVLDLYRKGLKVPEDVTIVWPDDNFGYIRNFASPEERRCSGGFGVYYHVSYLGRPLSYLWLCTTPPALIWEEMKKAYDYGADRLWILNVGDIKPAEIDIEFFLQMAWNIDRWNANNLPSFLTEWAAREFGPARAEEIGGIMAAYFQLNYQRRPEHLQWWLPKEPPRPSPFSVQEREERLAQFEALCKRVEAARAFISSDKLSAYTESVAYPVLASAAANQRYFYGEMGDKTKAMAFDAELTLLTNHYNNTNAGGKWRGFLRLEPADADWKSMRIARWTMPTFTSQIETNAGVPIVREAEQFEEAVAAAGSAWRMVPGLGRTGHGAITVQPFSSPSIPLADTKKAPTVRYRINFPAAGKYKVEFQLVPTHPISGGQLRFAFAIDEDEPQSAELLFKDGSEEWAQGVLNNVRLLTSTVEIRAAGEHTFQLFGIEPGVIVDRFRFFLREPSRSYLGGKAE